MGVGASKENQYQMEDMDQKKDVKKKRSPLDQFEIYPLIPINISLFGGRSARSAPRAAPAPSAGGSEACSMQCKALQDCLYNAGNNNTKCQSDMDKLADCLRNSSPVMSS